MQTRCLRLSCLKDCVNISHVSHVAVEAAQDRASAQSAFLLAAKGAPLQVKNKAGQTPLSLAGENASALQVAADSQLAEQGV